MDSIVSKFNQFRGFYGIGTKKKRSNIPIRIICHGMIMSGLIDGDAYNMSLAPGTRHQIVTAKIYSQLEGALKNKQTTCLVFIASMYKIFKMIERHL